MSYSFDFTSPNAENAKARVITEMEEVVRIQPSHKKDKDSAIAAAHAFIDLLADDPTHDVRVNLHGSLSYPYDANDPNCERSDTPFTAASVGVSAWHVPKKT